MYRGYFPRLTRFLNGMTRGVPLIEVIVNDTMLVVFNADRGFAQLMPRLSYSFKILRA